MQTEQHSSVITKGNARKLRALHILLLIFGAVMFVISSLFDNVWFDEAYTVGAVSNGMTDMIYYLAYDVHPHLYYILLKIWSYIFGNGIIALRMFSAVFGVACAALGYTHIRKDFGDKVGFWFSFFMVFSFSMLKYVLQIRMYTLAIFLITLTAVYAWRRLCDDSRKNRTLYLIFSILSAYTHYFAFFIIAMINVFTLARAIKIRSYKHWLIDAAIQFSAYAPGIAVFLLQISLDGANWIRVIYPEVIYDTVVHIFTGAPLSDDIAGGTFAYHAVGIGLTLIYAATFIKLVRDYKKDKQKYAPALLSYSVCLAVFAFTLAVSLFRPIYYQRYSVCFMGLLALSAAVLMANVKLKYLKSAAAVLLVACFLIVAVPFWQENFSENNDSYRDQIDITEEDLVIMDDFHAFVCTIEFPETKVVFNNLWGWPIDKTYRLFGENVTISQDISEFDSFNGRIWICGGETFKYFENRDDVIFICEKQLHTDYYNCNLTFRLYEKSAE